MYDSVVNGSNRQLLFTADFKTRQVARGFSLGIGVFLFAMPEGSVLKDSMPEGDAPTNNASEGLLPTAMFIFFAVAAGTGRVTPDFRLISSQGGVPCAI